MPLPLAARRVGPPPTGRERPCAAAPVPAFLPPSVYADAAAAHPRPPLTPPARSASSHSASAMLPRRELFSLRAAEAQGRAAVLEEAAHAGDLLHRCGLLSRRCAQRDETLRELRGHHAQLADFVAELRRQRDVARSTVQELCAQLDAETLRADRAEADLAVLREQVELGYSGAAPAAGLMDPPSGPAAPAAGSGLVGSASEHGSGGCCGGSPTGRGTRSPPPTHSPAGSRGLSPLQAARLSPRSSAGGGGGPCCAPAGPLPGAPCASGRSTPAPSLASEHSAASARAAAALHQARQSAARAALLSLAADEVSERAVVAAEEARDRVRLRPPRPAPPREPQAAEEELSPRAALLLQISKARAAAADTPPARPAPERAVLFSPPLERPAPRRPASPQLLSGDELEAIARETAAIAARWAPRPQEAASPPPSALPPPQRVVSPAHGRAGDPLPALPLFSAALSGTAAPPAAAPDNLPAPRAPRAEGAAWWRTQLARVPQAAPRGPASPTTAQPRPLGAAADRALSAGSRLQYLKQRYM
eukprot:TRINITY_DN6708_c0_g1_i1.p1 TRINITY_DN6708_c0_g1~~TRINITY_DN6708_c0_g1_i1.p1  ORF type:complete len:568 (+),score=143.64 TRINITY_DN6708_c0_g1_i1:99-1706(+)